MKKAAIEREKSQTRLSYSEREQARDKVSNGQERHSQVCLS